MFLTICILFTFLNIFSKNRWIFAGLFFKYPVEMTLVGKAGRQFRTFTLH
jgi:hypothetical protein